MECLQLKQSYASQLTSNYVVGLISLKSVRADEPSRETVGLEMVKQLPAPRIIFQEEKKKRKKRRI